MNIGTEWPATISYLARLVLSHWKSVWTVLFRNLLSASEREISYFTGKAGFTLKVWLSVASAFWTS